MQKNTFTIFFIVLIVIGGIFLFLHSEKNETEIQDKGIAKSPTIVKNTNNIEQISETEDMLKDQKDPDIDTKATLPADPGFSISYDAQNGALNIAVENKNEENNAPQDYDIQIVSVDEQNKERSLFSKTFSKYTYKKHVMEHGDTLWNIAHNILGSYYKYKVLKEQNNITDHYNISVGTKVSIKVQVAEYTLNKNDSVRSFCEAILKKPEISDKVAEFNMINAAHEIFLNQRTIYVPAYLMK